MLLCANQYAFPDHDVVEAFVRDYASTGSALRAKVISHQSCKYLVLFEAGVAFSLFSLLSTPPTHDIYTAAGSEQAPTQTDMPNPKENKKSCLQLDDGFSTSHLYRTQKNSWDSGGGRRTPKMERMAEEKRRYRKAGHTGIHQGRSDMLL